MTSIKPAGVGVTKVGHSASFTPVLAVSYYLSGTESYIKPTQIFISRYKLPGDIYPAGIWQNMQAAISFYPQFRPYLDFPKFYWDDTPVFPKELSHIEWKSNKTMTWDTTTSELGAGGRKTWTTRRRPRLRFEIKLTRINEQEKDILFSFIRKVKGAAKPFLWCDTEDNQLKGVELIRGKSGRYQVPIRVLGSFTEFAPLVKAETVYINGKPLSKDRYWQRMGVLEIYNEDKSFCYTGLPPVTADCVYYWRVTFCDDKLGIDHIFREFNKTNTLRMEVVR